MSARYDLRTVSKFEPTGTSKAAYARRMSSSGEGLRGSGPDEGRAALGRDPLLAGGRARGVGFGPGAAARAR